MLRAHDYFALRDALIRDDGSDRPVTGLSATRRALLTGVLRNKQLDLEASERALARFLRASGTAIDDRALVADLRGENAAKLSRYADAARWYTRAVALMDTIVAVDGDSAAAARRADLAISAQLWRTLASEPAQALRTRGAVRLVARRDAVGLMRVRMQLGASGSEVDAIFDTGADLTTLTRSVADRVGVRYPSGDSLQLDGVAGRTWARVAVIPTVTLGAATLTNVPALVLPDVALAVPALHYAMEAIVGLPVIRAFGRVTLQRGDTVTLGVPQPRSSLRLTWTGNLMIDALKPLLLATADGVPGIYTFDTGATESQLYPPFGRAHPALVAKAARVRQGIAGAGGSTQVESSNVGSVTIEIVRRTVTLTGVSLLDAMPRIAPGSAISGNLGQDVLRGLGTVTIDFERHTLAPAP